MTSPYERTEVFDVYWRYAAERQSIFIKRVAGVPSPWTTDPILQQYKFTNPYRASDRTSQYLIRHVIYGEGSQAPREVFFRILLFKLFNSVRTWERFVEKFGIPSWREYSFCAYAAVLHGVPSSQTIYSGAYVMPAPRLGEGSKYGNHLRLLTHIMDDRCWERVVRAKTFSDVFEELSKYKTFGPFLAYQYAIDLNYSEIINFSEMDFVVAGLGARDGIAKCFKNLDKRVSSIDFSQHIRYMASVADEEFSRLGLTFDTLWGRKLHLIDYQNIFCEISKYSRVSHPSVIGLNGNRHIKNRYGVSAEPLAPQWYPPKWGINGTPT